MPGKPFKWDMEIDEVLADFSRQTTEIQHARRLVETIRNGGYVPIEVITDVLARLDAKNHDAATALIDLKRKLQ
jgi:hypothetical protein